MPYVRQTSFLGGELDPKLWGRTDLPIFGSGLRRCRNFFISQHGAAVSRPGTKFVCSTQRGNASMGHVRLLPFVYSDTEAYAIEMGYRYARFIKNGQLVLETTTRAITGATQASPCVITANGHGYISGEVVRISGVVGMWQANERYFRVAPLNANAFQLRTMEWEDVSSATWSAYQSGGTATRVYTISTPYDSQDLAELQWAQSGDVLTLTHRAYSPYELTRLAETNWTLVDASFNRPAPIASDSRLLAPPPPGDLTHPAREWAWAVTDIRRDARGIVSESKPFHIIKDSAGVAIPSKVAVFSDKTVTVNIDPTYGPIATDPNFLAYRVYRGRGGLYGWVGDTKVATFTDVGQEPDYAMAPPQGLNPFRVLDSAGALIRIEQPCAVAYFQERRVFGGTTERPGFLFASTTGDYSNFDERLVPVADQALLFELAGRKREQIIALVGATRLLVFTDSSVWAIGGAGGSPLTPSSVETRVQTEVGAVRGLPPLLPGNGACLFVRAKGVGVRALVYQDERGGFVDADVSVVARHLFAGNNRSVKDWTYAEDPWGLVWVAMKDGTLLSLTYSESGVAAWAQHETAGEVLQVCAIPEGDEDAVYMVVKRPVPNSSAVRYSIERMTSRVLKGTPVYEDLVCLDCAKEVAQASPSVTVIGLYDLEGMSVYVTGKSNPPRGPYTVVNGSITLPEPPTANYGTAVVLYVGLLYTPEIETLDIASTEVRMKEKTVLSVGFEVDQSAGLWVGQDFNHLVEWRQRSVAASYGAISAASDLVRVPILGKWDQSARAVLRQTAPLPVTVLGLTREVDVGG